MSKAWGVVAALVLALAQTACGGSQRADGSKETAGDAWGNAWNSVVEGGQDVAHAGSVTIERTADGAVTAFDTTRRVGGRGVQAVSDVALLAQVKARLAADEDTGALGINVDVDDGFVTLRGDVDSPFEAGEALRLAASTDDVEGAISYLRWPGMPALRPGQPR